MKRIRINATGQQRAEPPFWLPLAAGLPIGLCMLVLALPALGNGQDLAYRTLYLVAYLAWCIPLTFIQRVLWRRRTPWWIFAPAMLSVTYVLALANNVVGAAMALAVGWERSFAFEWSGIFQGIDDCWLALIAFCAIHAVVAYYAELEHEQARTIEAVSLARDAELRALRYQLHPHFLFNGLNAISSLVANGRNDEARHMIARLGDFLRATLDGSESHEVALADEIALTETYLAIEKARLGDRLLLKWHIGPEVLSVRVPYLLLQPLVENAIRHGIALRSQPGKLDIHLTRHGDRLRVRIRNDGTAAAATPADERLQPSMLGLRNVSERLAKLYPGEHTMGVRADQNGDYRVDIELPFLEAAAPTGQWSAHA